MHSIKRTCFPPALALAVLLEATGAVSLSAATVSIPAGGLAAIKSGNDLILSFPTTTPELYTVQTSPDLVQPWTNLPSAVPGDGTIKTVTIPNAISIAQGFYRLRIQTSTRLLLPQSNAFSILGHSCGGIQEKVYVTGFDPASGYVAGEVYLSTTCSSGGRGSPPVTFTAWAAVSWDFAGNVHSSAALSNSATVNPTFAATDAYNDAIYNLNAAAYLVVPVPAVPTGVTAVQSGDQLQVSWTPNGVNPAAISSSTLTATPVNSTNSVLTAIVAGSATTGIIPTLQPLTTYQITIVNRTIGGSSPASAPVSVTTAAATIPPSAPAGVTASWTDLNPVGTNDTLVASWPAPNPGNSPIDLYLVTITGSDGGGTLTQTVSGATLTASFTVDWVPNWSLSVQAHNAAGWGPTSSVFMLGGL